MLSWLTWTAGSSAYVGYAQNASWGRPRSPQVPTGAIMFAHDVGDVEGRGGHFAAWEEPRLLTDDIRTFFRDLR